MKEQPREYQLVCTTPTGGCVLVLQGHHLEIGRSKYANIRVEDDRVSRHHARLEFVWGRWRVTDLGSTHGTFRDGWQLAPNSRTPLRDGDRLLMGNCEFLFIDELQRRFRDNLTGLPNHRAFEEAQNYCGAGDALVMFSIDRGKGGYVPSDSLICHVARIVRGCVPTIGDVFRHEATGFAAILPDCSRPMANRLAARIQRTLAECPRHSAEEAWTGALHTTVYGLS